MVLVFLLEDEDLLLAVVLLLAALLLEVLLIELPAGRFAVEVFVRVTFTVRVTLTVFFAFFVTVLVFFEELEVFDELADELLDFADLLESFSAAFWLAFDEAVDETEDETEEETLLEEEEALDCEALTSPCSSAGVEQLARPRDAVVSDAMMAMRQSRRLRADKEILLKQKIPGINDRS
ncbi:hypothetical protein CCHOA_05825 [Corynebacterium choanae]|uniref:Uncharacterized protein n=1 Tax=Corynebacterium choanae TaxID=1862358 RepID=A0A3G6J645_9CORY|nr:hypothetical protein CCHOA_05825 [Corynebacterium choanae]